MQSFLSIYSREYKLKIGSTYLVCDGYSIRKAKLVRVTERGFNFENPKDGKYLFKRHLYPREAKRDNVPELTFRFLRSTTIDQEQL